MLKNPNHSDPIKTVLFIKTLYQKIISFDKITFCTNITYKNVLIISINRNIFPLNPIISNSLTRANLLTN